MGFKRPSLYIANAWVPWEQPHVGTPLWTPKQLRPLEQLFKSASLGQAGTWFSSNTAHQPVVYIREPLGGKVMSLPCEEFFETLRQPPNLIQPPCIHSFPKTFSRSEPLPEGTAPPGALGPLLCQPGHRDPYQPHERWLPSCVLMCQIILKIMVIPWFFRKFIESCGQLDPGSGLYLSSATPLRWQTGWRRGFIIFMK